MIEPLPSDIFHAGEVLNNTYEVEGVLGRGGTGEVYRARNQISGRVLAIKALNAQFSGNADYVELMKREEQMRNIVNDAVVRYSECSRTGGGHVILVMDHIDGPSLNDLMLAGRMDAKDLLIIAHRVAEGLVETHRHGIVHRDLSPDNIILRDGLPEKATIIDFGIAKDTAAGARTIVGNDFAGKYEYAAPEQLEGRAEHRTDLYSLGATLLAAFRGEIPFPGATPGEIVRRKQQPLDTKGVPEPLKGLIDDLTKPDPADRPADAAEVMQRLDRALRPATGRAWAREPGPAGSKATSRRGRPSKWIAVPIVLVAAGAIAWVSGVANPFGPEPLPDATPYRLSAVQDPALAPSLVANAPDDAAAEMLRSAYAQAAGRPPEDIEITLATGLPVEDWPSRAAGLLRSLQPLESWDLSMEDMSARVEGFAPGTAERDRIAAELRDWGAANGVTLRTSLVAGPRLLPAADVADILKRHASCGPLSQAAEDGTTYRIGDRIVVTGDVASAAGAEAIRQALAAAAGDRPVVVDAVTLNDDLCAIRAVLPPTPPSALSLWLGDGDTGQANLSGVYVTGQNPIVEVHAPQDSTGSLWVMVIDNTGKVFNVLPNINRAEHQLGQIGDVEGGLRRVRVLWSQDEFRTDPTRLAMRVTEGDYGKSEVIAILSRSELFDTRRPRDESVASLVEALSEAIAGREDDILGVATRIIDARP